jgi:hypothetical protein
MIDIASISTVFNLLQDIINGPDWGSDASLTFIYIDVSNVGWDGDP